MKPEETLDFHLRWAWHNIARIYNAEAARHGITMSTGFVLLSIDQKEGTPSTKLGPKMGMEPRSLTRTLKSMEEENLIHRKSDKSDKRSVRIFLTEKGKKKREIARTKVVYFNETMQKKLGKKNVSEFFSTMSELNELLEDFKFEK
ncbi:MAG TPA: MarR family transcriptional regulator [Flavobacteriales bacterium]|nr:MarR family transcriptional regulator [Flavobacteriales bacterium]